ncbi:2-keto-4-pentenoate hydratase/2-oxohepta-3-ene-1,7-dioic acid hydratase (catechol pathway) [Actinopolyspora xinjiangensis]|uniref:2-keto-4-pentenoate hydratase/2-oxohepta-3-ene-1,7-dioic acid hydratase (Catechol pathway) n=1 Tax=Actinopolyspora xinjiangensis TaxID=405564 RepID=A0A1H0S7V3_9ACTN|nr:fumarylacetoacetate hydrolase family protein [Actinopolyspora xinjiangensis]SDP37306.1 2-keto-4-pentenoate hydratase/2-oxohepta-3-ene-1,7-dioic acid hydratase (catechol pathway) [Actinopolyspora xinjiangensis]
MRFATVEESDGSVRCGVVVDDVLHRLPPGTNVLDLLRAGTLSESGDAALSEGDTVPLAGVRLLPPLEVPSVRDFVAFEEHVEGVRRSVEGQSGVVSEWYEAPAFYFTNPHSLLGAHDDVAPPPGCAVLDFELEVAAIVGREGADLTSEQARSHIAGYTVFNDWSARDLQGREMRVGLGPAKGKDFAGTLGPVLVTADELEPYRDADGFLRLAMTVSVNGTEVGRDLLSNMGWPFEELLSHAARGSRVLPGDVLGSGTCGNGGCLAELWGRSGARQPPPLRSGDVVEMWVEGIGAIANAVVDGVASADAPPVPSARRRDRQRP